MQVASLDNCKELFELSGWAETTGIWYPRGFDNGKPVDWYVKPYVAHLGYPAYDTGYLLRKLPIEMIVSRCTNGDWSARANGVAMVRLTPEDALASLAIELHKQGVLKKAVV